jgi:crotonobetainyl-CoA:carnitine CoA-transferase CaiB-like acyl-CoA transferase
MLGLQNEREWKLFATPCCCARSGHRCALQQQCQAQRQPRGAAGADPDVFNALTAAQVVERLDAAGIANARVNDMAGLWAHPQLAARQRWRSVDTPAGRCRRCCRPA